MDGLFGSANKRQFRGPPVRKEDEDGVGTDRAIRDADDPNIRASSETIKARRFVPISPQFHHVRPMIASLLSTAASSNTCCSLRPEKFMLIRPLNRIAAPKSRRPGASRDGSVDRHLGNPFAQIPGSTPTNASNGFGAAPFGQQSAFAPSAAQSFPPNNNSNPFAQSSAQPFAFGSQPSSSFPPASNLFGQQQQQPPPPQSSAFTFGASAPATNHSNPFSFGASTPQATPSAPSFSFSSATQKPAFNNSTFSFGTTNNTSSTPSSKPAETGNLFSGASNGFSFGAAPTQNTSSTITTTTTAAVNPFTNQTPSSESAGGLFSTKPTTGSSLFPATAASTPSQIPPLFGASPTASQSPATGFVQNGLLNNDDMMTSPPATPPKKTSAFNEQPPASASTTSASKPPTVDNPFAGIKMPPPTPSSSSQANVASPFQASQPFAPFAQSTPKAPTPNIFAPQPETAKAVKETPVTASPSLPSFAVGSSASTPLPKTPLFSPAPQTQAPAAEQIPAATQSYAGSPATGRAAPKAQEQYRRLNQSFKARLLSMNEDYDWSPMFHAYLAQVERMRESLTPKPAVKRSLGLDAEDSEPKRAREAEPEPEQQAQVPATPPPPQSLTNLFAPQTSTTPTASPSKSQTANLFASIVGNTPQQSSPQLSNSFFSPKPPAATQPVPAPAQGLNLFANPPAGAPPTPSLFGASATSTTPKPTASAASPQKQPSEKAEQPFNPFSSMKTMSAQPAQPSPPKASAAAAEAAPAGPKFELPKFSTPAVDAFAAFGAQAEKSKLEAEKAAEKKELDARFDDEYDSDNETEAAFNKRVLAEIRAKRAKAKEEKAAAPAQAVFQPGKGFSFTSTASSSGKGADSQETPPSSAEVTPETAKPTLFSPAPSTAVGGRSIFDTAVKPAASNTSLFSNLAKPPAPTVDDAEDSADEGQSDAPSLADSNGVASGSKSLFDRISKPSGSENATPNGHASEPSGALFGAQDRTWKNDSPIKFGDSTGSSTTPTKSNGNGFGDLTTPAPKPFTNIFGSAKANSTPSLFSQSTTKPVVGFAFGPSSNGTSEAASVSPSSTREGSVAATTTTTTDETTHSSNGDANNLDGVAADAQVSLTDLSEEERRDNDVLFEVSSARVQAYDGKAKTWQKRGLGPLRVLKNKESDKTWILARSNPQGKVIINTALLKGMSYDSPAKGRVKFPMVDRDGGKMTTVLVTVKADEDAKKLAEVLSANKPE